MPPESDRETTEFERIKEAEQQGKLIAMQLGEQANLEEVRYRIVHEVNHQYIMHAAIAFNDYRKEQGWQPFE